MSQDAAMSWKEECDAIHREMDRLLTAGWLESAEERQVRKIQFMALIERRNVAAHNFMKSDGDAVKVSIGPQKPSGTPGVLPHGDPASEVDIVDVNISQESSEVARATDRSPQALPDDAIFEFETVGVAASEEPSEAALAIERDPRAPPADSKLAVETKNVKVSEEPSAGGAGTRDRNPPAAPGDPVFEVKNFLRSSG
jgi:hypothetical protein